MDIYKEQLHHHYYNLKQKIFCAHGFVSRKAIRVHVRVAGAAGSDVEKVEHVDTSVVLVSTFLYGNSYS